MTSSLDPQKSSQEHQTVDGGQALASTSETVGGNASASTLQGTLLPCPFCNGAGFWQSEHDRDGGGVFWAIRCGKCGCATQQHYVSHGNDCPQFRAEVRAAWNRRAVGGGLQVPPEPAAWTLAYGGTLSRSLYETEADATKELRRRNTVYQDDKDKRRVVPLYAALPAAVEAALPMQEDKL